MINGIIKISTDKGGGKVDSQEKGIKVYVTQKILVHCGVFRVEPFTPAVNVGLQSSEMCCLPSLITVFIRLYHRAGLTLHFHHIIIPSGHNIEK